MRCFCSLFSDDRTTGVTDTELHGSGRLSLNRQEPAAVSAYKGESPTGVSTLEVDGCFGGWIMVWLAGFVVKPHQKLHGPPVST